MAARKFKDALDRHDVSYTYIQNDKHGHIIAGYQNMRDYGTWMRFLSGDNVHA